MFFYGFEMKIENRIKIKISFKNLNCNSVVVPHSDWYPRSRVCYERCPIKPTAATFLLSAMWHGAYPGYYLTFVTGILVTLAARAVSASPRPPSSFLCR